MLVHRFEAKYYDLLHPEVYSKQEQKRVTAQLKKIDSQLQNTTKKALDVGAGTGNLTGKLLQMGYSVTAIDISPEMCAILRKKYADYLGKQLTVINSALEELTFDAGGFDLITCYSVLHHFPDYIAALKTLAGFLKKGGVLYVDHEVSPFYWKHEPKALADLVKNLYFHLSPALNSLYFGVIGLKVPNIDYTLSDYWHKKGHAIDHKAIQQVFVDQGFESWRRTDYYQHTTWVLNPIFPLYRVLCKPEMSFWSAKK